MYWLINIKTYGFGCLYFIFHIQIQNTIEVMFYYICFVAVQSHTARFAFVWSSLGFLFFKKRPRGGCHRHLFFQSTGGVVLSSRPRASCATGCLSAVQQRNKSWQSLCSSACEASQPRSAFRVPDFFFSANSICPPSTPPNTRTAVIFFRALQRVASQNQAVGEPRRLGHPVPRPG